MTEISMVIFYMKRTVEIIKGIRFLRDIGMSFKQINIYKESNNNDRRKQLNIETLNRLNGIIEEPSLLELKQINEYFYLLKN